MLAKLPYPQTIKEAAIQLDTLIPLWYNQVYVSYLSMCSPSNCILGQLGGFHRLLDNWKDGHRQHSNDPFCQGDNEWKLEITQRRNNESVGNDPLNPPIQHIKGVINIMRNTTTSITYKGVTLKFDSNQELKEFVESLKNIVG